MNKKSHCFKDHCSIDWKPPSIQPTIMKRWITQLNPFSLIRITFVNAHTFFPLASTVFQDYFRPYATDPEWPHVVRSGLLALWLLQAPTHSLISGSAGVSQWLWSVTLLPTAGLNLGSGQSSSEPLQETVSGRCSESKACGSRRRGRSGRKCTAGLCSWAKIIPRVW